jgi:hypothetical protein
VKTRFGNDRHIGFIRPVIPVAKPPVNGYKLSQEVVYALRDSSRPL